MIKSNCLFLLLFIFLLHHVSPLFASTEHRNEVLGEYSIESYKRNYTYPLVEGKTVKFRRNSRIFMRGVRVHLVKDSVLTPSTTIGKTTIEFREGLMHLRNYPNSGGLIINTPLSSLEIPDINTLTSLLVDVRKPELVVMKVIKGSAEISTNDRTIMTKSGEILIVELDDNNPEPTIVSNNSETDPASLPPVIINKYHSPTEIENDITLLRKQLGMSEQFRPENLDDPPAGPILPEK